MEQALKNILVLLNTMNSKLDTLDVRTEGIADLKNQVQEIELRVSNLEDRNFQLLKRIEALEITNTSKVGGNITQPAMTSGTGNIHQNDDISWKTEKYSASLLPNIGAYSKYRSVNDSDEEDDYDDYDDYNSGGIRDICDYDSDTGICEY